MIQLKGWAFRLHRWFKETQAHHRPYNILMHFPRSQRSWSQRVVIWFYMTHLWLKADKLDRELIKMAKEIAKKVNSDSEAKLGS